MNRWTWSLAALSTLTLVAAANWQSLSLGLAVARSETRPALLRNAKWNEPDSAREFQARFTPGSPEARLRAWLLANDFEIDDANRRASKRIRATPCNEHVAIEWTRGNDATIGNARATVSESGCL